MIGPPARAGTVLLIWRDDTPLHDVADETCATVRLLGDALRAQGLTAVEIGYREGSPHITRAMLRRASAALIWVNPIQDARDRTELDGLLREASTRGTWVSTHPDVIDRMGTKEVLYRARIQGWDADTHLYRTPDELRAQLPARLARRCARVLKQNRGNNGIGVWKVEAVTAEPVRPESLVRIEQAYAPASAVERIPFAEFVDRVSAAFALGPIVDQQFQTRLADGMIRAYFVRDEIVGFCRQQPRGLLSGSAEEPALDEASPRFVMERAEAPEFASLLAGIESRWLPELMVTLGLDRATLPAIWDADFLYGASLAGCEPQFVLCEINVSAVWPFPAVACASIARAVLEYAASSRPRAT